MISFLTIVGSLALVGGSIGYVTFPMGLSFGIKQAINLAQNGLVYPLYMKPPFSANSTFHLFAVKNPREVLRGGKMSFDIKGPYEFRTWLVRENIAFTQQDEKVRYDSSRSLVPMEQISADFDEKMWLVNPVLPVTMRQVRSMIIDRVPFKRLTEPIVFNTVNLLLDNYGERLLMRSTPRQILMGRKVKLLESLVELAGRFGASSLLPPRPPENTFGLAFVQNVTVDKVEIYTGLGKTKDKFAEMSAWRGKTKMDLWSGKCSSISGTNGELYKPLLEEGKPMRVFLGPLCRSFFVEATGDGPVMTSSGIRGHEYQISPRLFLGARNNPANKCFCETIKTYECQFDGLLAMGPCFFDTPIYFSRANFKGVDERMKRLVNQDSFERLLPDKQTFAIEPITGTVLNVNLTLMALVKVTRQAYMRDLSNVQNLTYAPLFATTESVSLPYEYAWQIYLLQKFNDYHKPIMAATAATGLGTLVFKWVFGP